MLCLDADARVSLISAFLAKPGLFTCLHRLGQQRQYVLKEATDTLRSNAPVDHAESARVLKSSERAA